MHFILEDGTLSMYDFISACMGSVYYSVVELLLG